MNRKVLVITEMKGAALRQVSLEGVSIGKKMAGSGTLIAAVFGSQASPHVEALGEHGADQVLLFPDALFDAYHSDIYYQAFVQAIQETNPDVIIAGHTANMKDVAPRIASRFGYGLVTDCTHVEFEGDEPVYVRPIYAGKAFEKKRFTSDTMFVTIRPNNFKAEPLRERATPEVIPCEAGSVDLRTVIRDIVLKSTGAIDLAEAKIAFPGTGDQEQGRISAFAGTGRRDRRSGRGFQRRLRRRVLRLRPANRSDGQGRDSRSVYRMRDFRSDPARCRHIERQNDYCD